jgi:uncharacterized protein with HEPN domain
MSKERRDWDYLRDIQDAIENIALYTECLIYDEFMKDRKTQDATSKLWVKRRRICQAL